MRRLRIRLPRDQRGAVLIIALIMLAVMTLFVISMLKTSVLELRIGGASQIAAMNLSNAEIAINQFIAGNSGRFAPGFIDLPAGKPGAMVAGTLSYTDPLGNTAVLTPLQLACGQWYGIGTQYGSNSLQSVQWDVTSTATGTLGYGGTTVVHQGLQSVAAPGAC